MEKQYAIVQFIDEADAPGVVALQWCNVYKTKWYYPNVLSNESRDKLLKTRVEPQENWWSCSIEVMHEYGENFIRISIS